MEEIIQADYKCTQAELYAIIRKALQNYQNNLSKFTALKSKYDAAFGNAIGAAVDAAEALPSKEQRDMDSETFHGELIELNKNCLKKWNTLESYIKEVYTGTALKPALQAAGSLEYDYAANKNWEKTIAMNVAAKGFMGVPANTTKLENGGTNMPAGFPADYDATALLFSKKYDEYSEASETTTATNKKTKANNEVYKSCMSLLNDGKTIGENDEDGAFVKMFTWSELKSFVSPPKSASMEVEALDQTTLQPVTGVKVVMQEAGGAQITFECDANGIGKAESLDPGVYKGIAKAPNYNDYAFVKEVNKGTGAGLKILMTAV